MEYCQGHSSILLGLIDQRPSHYMCSVENYNLVLFLSFSTDHFSPRHPSQRNTNIFQFLDISIQRLVRTQCAWHSVVGRCKWILIVLWTIVAQPKLALVDELNRLYISIFNKQVNSLSVSVLNNTFRPTVIIIMLRSPFQFNINNIVVELKGKIHFDIFELRHVYFHRNIAHTQHTHTCTRKWF